MSLPKLPTDDNIRTKEQSLEILKENLDAKALDLLADLSKRPNAGQKLLGKKQLLKMYI
ncbi:MAG: hypothetical protein AAF363_15750 [Bacteroidota bacterium]